MGVDVLLNTKKEGANLQQDTVSRESVVNNNSWMLERDKPFVIHNDIDGLLSAMLLSQKVNWNLVGFYDLKSVWFDTSFEGSIFDPIYIDLDVTHFQARSAGHHIILQHGKFHVNPNLLFNKNIYNFETKYPLGEILFLLWLYDEKLPVNKDSWYWLLHADSSWESYYGKVTEKTERLTQIIERNVDDWLRSKLNFPPLADFLRQHKYQDFKRRIDELIMPNKFGRGDQFSFRMQNWDRERTGIVDVLNHLESVLSWSATAIPRKLRKVRELVNFTLSDYDRDMFSKVLPYFRDNIFSHGVTYFNPPSMKVSLIA